MAEEKRRARRERWELLIAALLTEITIEAASAKAGCSSRYVRKLMRDKRFLALYRARRREFIDTVNLSLQKVAMNMVGVLLKATRCGDTRQEVRAASILLDRALRSTDADIEERFAELEEQVREL